MWFSLGHPSRASLLWIFKVVSLKNCVFQHLTDGALTNTGNKCVWQIYQFSSPWTSDMDSFCSQWDCSRSYVCMYIWQSVGRNRGVLSPFFISLLLSCLVLRVLSKVREDVRVNAKSVFLRCFEDKRQYKVLIIITN